VQQCERDAQTDPVATHDSETQASLQASAAIQTDEVAPAVHEAITQVRWTHGTRLQLNCWLAHLCGGLRAESACRRVDGQG
jgi:hypothetical protein